MLKSVGRHLRTVVKKCSMKNTTNQLTIAVQQYVCLNDSNELQRTCARLRSTVEKL